MNRELELLILAFEAVSASRDEEAKKALQVFETKLDEILNSIPVCPGTYFARASSRRTGNGRCGRKTNLRRFLRRLESHFERQLNVAACASPRLALENGT
jgi:hypothetical protein